MSDLTFYKNLKPIKEFIKVADPQNYVDLPDDWFLVLSDIVSSTQAIEEGRYKDVNTLGAALIIAMQNTAPELELPFVFGGDGSLVAVPPELLEQSKVVLQSVESMGMQSFKLDIRGAIIPVWQIKKLGGELKIAKLFISNLYNQALFHGNGLDIAEQMLKDPNFRSMQVFANNSKYIQADFNGLECRWQDVPGRHGEILSLIVRSQSNDMNQAVHTYEEVITGIENIFGKPLNYQPVLGHQLQLAMSPQRLDIEAKVKSHGSKLQEYLGLAKIWIINLIGEFQEQTGITVNGFNLQKKKQAIQISTDFKKFDGALKMVISSTPKQRMQLTNFLNALQMSGLIRYGIHNSDRALMTCLVFEKMGREVHFVDGADGGYALAAKQLKQSFQPA